MFPLPYLIFCIENKRVEPRYIQGRTFFTKGAVIPTCGNKYVNVNASIVNAFKIMMSVRRVGL